MKRQREEDSCKIALSLLSDIDTHFGILVDKIYVMRYREHG